MFLFNNFLIFFTHSKAEVQLFLQQILALKFSSYNQSKINSIPGHLWTSQESYKNCCIVLSPQKKFN